MMWIIQQGSAGNARRCHPGRQSLSLFHSGNRAEVFIWRNFQPAYWRPRLEKPRSREPSHPALSYEQGENFTRDLEVRRDLRNPARTVNRVHVQRLLPKHWYELSVWVILVVKKIKCHNVSERDNFSQQVLMFVTIKSSKRSNKPRLFVQDEHFPFAKSRLMVYSYFYFSLCTYFQLSFQSIS